MASYSLVEVAIEAVLNAREEVKAALYSVACLDQDLLIDVDGEQFLLGGRYEEQLSRILSFLHQAVPDLFRAGAIQAAYRWSVLEPVEATHTHKWQSGSSGEFAAVTIAIAPVEGTFAFQFVSEVPIGHIPGEFLPSIERGARSAAEARYAHGIPFANICVRLLDGQFHDIDSSAAAFERAARDAVGQALRKAKLRLVEPHVWLAVLTPEQAITAVTTRLERRGATICDVRAPGTGLVVASGRMVDLLGCEAELRSISGGSATVMMILDRYVEVPFGAGPQDTEPVAAALWA